MKTNSGKIIWGFVLAVCLFAAPCFESNAVLAGGRRVEKLPAKETVAEFLSSIELGERAYDFDHNGDGVADMYVYPLITTEPDLKTKYITLEEAVKKRQVVLKENTGNRSLNKKDPPSSYSIVAQIGMVGGGSRSGYGGYGRGGYGGYGRGGYGGYGRGGYGGSGYGSRYGSGYGSGSGSSMYYQRGGMMGGGWQGRGIGMGGTLGGYGYGRGYNGNYRSSGYRGGARSIGGFGFNNDALKVGEFSKVAAMGELNSASTGVRPSQNSESVKPADKVEVELGTFCFEKWRLIEESRRMGEPEYFSYVGMASPFVRKQLVLFPNQTNMDIIIEKELRKLGVHSKTNALADVLKNPGIKKIIDYYVVNSKKVLGKNKGISGMIVTSRNKVLCADIYSSPGLFRKMFPQLMQSAALGVCQTDKRGRKYLEKSDVEKFFAGLRQVKKVKKEASQTYRIFYPKVVSSAELLSNKNGTRVVHLEAYPR